MEDQRDFIDPFHVLSGDDRLFFHVAEMGDLRLNLPIEEAIRAAKQNIRLDPQTGKFFNAMLSRFGLELSAAGDIGHEREMNVQNSFPAPIPSELTNGFQKRQPFDVSDGSTDFTNRDIVAFGRG